MLGQLFILILFAILLFVGYNLYYDALFPNTSNPVRDAWKEVKEFLEDLFFGPK